MKWLFILTGILFYAGIAAADSGLTPLAPQPKPAIVIVNGKKFFPMQNARRFTGSIDSPSAQSVLHHPRPQAKPASHYNALSPASAPAAGASSQTSVPGQAKAQPDPILSIFEPEEKTVPAAASAIPGSPVATTIPTK